MTKCHLRLHPNSNLNEKGFIVFSGLFLSGVLLFSQQDSMRLVDLQEVQVLSTDATDVTPVAYSI